MPISVSIPDDVYALIASLARPFVDKEPVDVIRRLVLKEVDVAEPRDPSALSSGSIDVTSRSPRLRGAIVELDSFMIRADSVPDLFTQVMEYLHGHGHWSKVLALAPYKTSEQRYLFSRTPQHPSGKGFFVELKCHDLHVEAHKNYRIAIQQLTRFLEKCSVKMTYKGS